MRRRPARPANKGWANKGWANKGWAPEFFGIVEGSDLPEDRGTNTDHHRRGSRASESRTAAINAALGDLDGTDAAAVSRMTGGDADDTGPLVALSNERDEHHVTANNLFRDLHMAGETLLGRC